MAFQISRLSSERECMAGIPELWRLDEEYSSEYSSRGIFRIEKNHVFKRMFEGNMMLAISPVKIYIRQFFAQSDSILFFAGIFWQTYSAADRVRPSLQEQTPRSCDAAEFFEHVSQASHDITNSPK